MSYVVLGSWFNDKLYCCMWWEKTKNFQFNANQKHTCENIWQIYRLRLDLIHGLFMIRLARTANENHCLECLFINNFEILKMKTKQFGNCHCGKSSIKDLVRCFIPVSSLIKGFTQRQSPNCFPNDSFCKITRASTLQSRWANEISFRYSFLQ